MSKKKIINKIVGKNIQYLIDCDPDMNKNKLARELGVDRRTVSRWTNENIFPEEHIFAIAKQFGVSADVLLSVDMTNGTDQAGEEHWSTLRSNINNVNQINAMRDSFINYLHSLGVEISFERSTIKGTDIHAPLPDRVRLSLDGKSNEMDYSDYEKMREEINKATIKKLHICDEVKK